LNPRWQKCVTLANNGLSWIPLSGFGWIISRFFIDVAYSEESRKFTNDILTSIKDQFLVKLAEKDWLDEEVKQVATEKVKQMLQMVGYPDDPSTVDPLALKDYYKSLKVGNSHFVNVLSQAQFGVAYRWSAIAKDSVRTEWRQTSPTVNAYYAPFLNEIVVPAGIQQFPIFSNDFPSYVVFGGMGSVAGHELVHGFDNNGRRFAPDGTLTNWWTNTSLAEYQERTTCFIDQYSKFTVEGKNGSTIKVNGVSTLGENVADAGGVNLAYGAWKAYQTVQLRKRSERIDGSLPGLENFTHDQIFFLRFAQTWCSKSNPTFLEGQIATDPHSPDFARILGPLANSRDFKKAFKCPNVEPTCELW
jgi:endothelin-converting enzyme